jgi:hypothetical protein
VYGLSLRVPDDVQKPSSFCGAKFLRNHSRSGHNHVLGRLYYCTRTFASVQNFEQGEGMLGDLVMVRIGSHCAGSLRRVDKLARVATLTGSCSPSASQKRGPSPKMLWRSLEF